MALLAGVLPGLRDARNPTVAGLGWLFAFALTDRVFTIDILKRSGLDVAFSIVQQFPQPVLVGSVLLTAYVIGDAARILQRAFGPALGHGLSRWLSYDLFDLSGRQAKGFWTGADRWRRSVSVHWDRVLQPSWKGSHYISEAVRQVVRSAGAHPDTALLLPPAQVMRHLPSTRSLVASDPVAFQELDRLDAEVGFRTSVAGPLCMVGIVLASSSSIWWMPASSIVVGLILSAAADLRKQAGDLLTLLVEQQKVKVPLLESVRQLLDQDPDRADREGAATALIAGLYRVGFQEDAGRSLELFAHHDQTLPHDVYALCTEVRKRVPELASRIDELLDEHEAVASARSARLTPEPA